MEKREYFQMKVARIECANCGCGCFKDLQAFGYFRFADKTEQRTWKI